MEEQMVIVQSGIVVVLAGIRWAAAPPATEAKFALQQAFETG